MAACAGGVFNPKFNNTAKAKYKKCFWKAMSKPSANLTLAVLILGRLPIGVKEHTQSILA